MLCYASCSKSHGTLKKKKWSTVTLQGCVDFQVYSKVTWLSYIYMYFFRFFYTAAAAAAAKSLQSCPTLCDPRDGSPPGSLVPGILQARTLERVAISFSNAWKWKVKVKSLSRVQLFATLWTAAHQSPLSMGFSRQEYWSGVPSPSLSFTLKVIIRYWTQLPELYRRFLLFIYFTHGAF